MKPVTGKMLAKVEDGVGWMIFNNPAKRNAVSLDMWEAIPQLSEMQVTNERI